MSDLICATNESKGIVLASRVKMASSLWARSRGLLGTVSLPDGAGLWLRPCRSIHMFFMRYAIDALFINNQGVVVHTTTLAPWRMSRWVPQADGVLELPAGTLARTKTGVGDKVSLKQI